MRKHCKSIVRVVEFRLCVVSVFLVFGIADISNLLQICPLVQSSLVSVFRHEIQQKWSKNGSGGSQKSGNIFKVWSVRSFNPFGLFGLVVGSAWVVQGGWEHFGASPKRLEI